jgi:hypothetical protein
MTSSTGVVDLLGFGAMGVVVSGPARAIAAKPEAVYGPSSQKEVGIDLRVSFLLARTRHKMVADFPELYRRIEEECERAGEVLASLGFSKLSDRVVFYRFRKRCLKWGVWVAADEFAASSRSLGLSYFDPSVIKHWRDLRGYVAKGMVPALSVSFLQEVAAVRRGGGVEGVVGRVMNRRRLRKLPLDVWVTLGLTATEIWRFLEPFFVGLAWWQVYLHAREIRKSLRKKGSVPTAMAGDPVPGGVKLVSFPGEVKGEAVVNGEPSAAAVGKASADGLSELFGELPAGGRVDKFLVSEQGAKLRSGAFWCNVIEESGADLRGHGEFAGLNVEVGPGGLGKLLEWCESFSLALTRSLGFKDVPYLGKMVRYPDYRSFHPWFAVMGHLLGTVWRSEGFDRGRRGELNSYFAESRVRLVLPKSAGVAEFASVEEAFTRYLVHSRLGLADILVAALALEWKMASRMSFGDKESPLWRSVNYNVLFAEYAKVVFAEGPAGLLSGLKRGLFKEGVFA